MFRLRYIYTQPNMFVLLNVLEVMASKCLDSNVPEWCQGQRTSIKFGHGYWHGRFNKLHIYQVSNSSLASLSRYSNNGSQTRVRDPPGDFEGDYLEKDLV
ncbi:hypothetical protein CEXT_491291 [Caerostris extrusa]|uniref:Uncharacterized protein n=1 Tax=Caerostris extrusa TaxID=172846 RepID=A0AAV4SZ38_CAEEX|nr:hypothetical protein CEXT_491291 [Caerostris extrusa]